MYGTPKDATQPRLSLAVPQPQISGWYCTHLPFPTDQSLSHRFPLGSVLRVAGSSPPRDAWSLFRPTRFFSCPPHVPDAQGSFFTARCAALFGGVPHHVDAFSFQLESPAKEHPHPFFFRGFLPPPRLNCFHVLRFSYWNHSSSTCLLACRIHALSLFTNRGSPGFVRNYFCFKSRIGWSHTVLASIMVWGLSGSDPVRRILNPGLPVKAR